MSHIDMRQFMCLDDNYGVLLHDSVTGATASIDAPDAEAVEAQLRKYGRQLTHIFTTHHHADHVQGNLRLKELFGCKIIGPKAEADKIPGIDIQVSGGDKFIWSHREVFVYDCPGHTAGHISFSMPSEFSLFAGDTIFAVGCGRVLEGTFEQMYQSVNQFKTLSPSTYIYCGHEYTEANIRFALTIEPGNKALSDRAHIVAKQRANGEMTCPTTLADELKTNPYLRCNSPEIRNILGMETASDAEVFAEIRTRKNNFK
ncbi:MAG: hydroxyacylglutathione hydrolase [Alphaproteobacteria bacterium]|nr:hydroxyacylglutathione hydrolase [Alphaproteobacteria bacterium]